MMIVIVLLISRISETVKDFIIYTTLPALFTNNPTRAVLLAAIFWPITTLVSGIIVMTNVWIGLEWAVKKLCFTKEEQKEIEEEEEKEYTKRYTDPEYSSNVAYHPPPCKPPAPPIPPSMRIIDEDFHLCKQTMVIKFICDVCKEGFTKQLYLGEMTRGKGGICPKCGSEDHGNFHCVRKE
jgi:hypothetical protein